LPSAAPKGARKELALSLLNGRSVEILPVPPPKD